MNIMIYYIVIASLTVGNFLYALVWSGNFRDAAERSFFQMTAVVTCFVIKEILWAE